MERAAIYHRPESEMAYLEGKNQFHIRLRTKHADVRQVEVIYGNLGKIQQHITDERPNVDGMQCTLKTDLYDYWEATIPVKARERTQYLFHLVGNGDQTDDLLYDTVNVRVYMADYLERAVPFHTPYYQNMFLVRSIPEWTKHTVWYQVMIDRFANGDDDNDPVDTAKWDDPSTNANFYGGDLRGIIDHLDYLTELGVNGIKLSPIFDSYSNRKKDPVDFYDISYMYGSKGEFEEFMQAAHQHGIRVMVQLPLDRMSVLSLQWQDVQRLGAQSRFANWFKIRSFPVQLPTVEDAPDKHYLVAENNALMPKLNLQNPAVQQYILEMVRYWVETFDIDGWEVLNADEVDQTFLNLLTQQMHGLKADFVVAGNYQDFPNADLAKGYIDSSNNSTLNAMVHDCLIDHRIKIGEMISQINTSLMKNASYINQTLMNEIENFDTSRLISACGENSDLARAIIAFMFVQIGNPSFMYGTEVGVTGGAEPANLASMKWEPEQQSQTMLSFMKDAIAMRRENADILNAGTMEWGQFNDKYQFLTLTRSYDGKRIFCLFNFGPGKVKIVIPHNAQVVLSQNLQADESKVTQNGFVILKM